MYIADIVCPITMWARENNIDDKDAASNQICFVRDNLSSCLADSYEEYIGITFKTDIIGEHVSKSIKLPVYELKYRNCTFIMRNNFYNWKISVILSSSIPLLLYDDFNRLFDPSLKHSVIHCEGFAPRDVYQSFNEYKTEMLKGELFPSRKFTIEIYDNMKLYAFFYVLKTQYLLKYL